MKELTEEFIKTLKSYAENKSWDEQDDFDPKDMSGGNFDDAYSGGESAGETNMARKVLRELGIEFTIEQS
jgi:hypothetical protein